MLNVEGTFGFQLVYRLPKLAVALMSYKQKNVSSLVLFHSYSLTHPHIARWIWILIISFMGEGTTRFSPTSIFWSVHSGHCALGGFLISFPNLAVAPNPTRAFLNIPFLSHSHLPIHHHQILFNKFVTSGDHKLLL
jgi:hypothetical protein